MTIATEQEILEARFHAKAVEKIEKRYNAHPNHDKYKLPVITVEDPEHITMRYWGMVPVWWKRDTRGLINVKEETLREKKKPSTKILRNAGASCLPMVSMNGKGRRDTKSRITFD